MIAHKRKQVVSKKAQTRATCQKKPGYQQEYTVAYQDHSATTPSRPHYSESPARTGSAQQSSAQQKGHGGADYRSQLGHEKDTGANAQRMLVGLHGLSKSKSKYLNTSAAGQAIEKVNPYLNMCQSSQDVHHNWTDKRDFNAYKRSADKKRRGKAQRADQAVEFEDSLAQSSSQISLPGADDHVAGAGLYRPRRRVSQSPGKSPTRWPRAMQMGQNSPSKAQISADSTVLYDPQNGARQTTVYGVDYPVKSPMTRPGEARGTTVERVERAQVLRVSPKKHFLESNFSKASLTPQSAAKSDSVQKLKAHRQVAQQHQTAAARLRRQEKSPVMAMPAFAGLAEDTAPTEPQRKVDVLHYGRAKRDEIVERLQAESLKHFQALQRVKTKSCTAATSSKRPRGAKVHHEPPLANQEDNADVAGHATLGGWHCHHKTPNQETPGSRLYAPTKSSQAKVEAPPPGRHRQQVAEQPHSGARHLQAQAALAECPQADLHGEMHASTTPKTRTRKAQRQSRQERSYKAARSAMRNRGVAAPLLTNQRRLAEEFKGSAAHQVSEQEQNGEGRLDTRGSSRGDWMDELSQTQDSLQQEKEKRRKRAEYGIGCTQPGQRVTKAKRIQPIAEIERPASATIAKKHQPKSALRHYDGRTETESKSSLMLYGQPGPKEDQLHKTQSEMKFKDAYAKDKALWSNTEKAKDAVVGYSALAKQKNKMKEMQANRKHQTTSLHQLRERPSLGKYSKAGGGKEKTSTETTEPGKAQSSEQLPTAAEEDPVEPSEPPKSVVHAKSSHYSPTRRWQTTGGTKSKAIPTAKSKVWQLPEEDRLQFLRDKLEAVVIGHKTRRIYRCNKTIRQYRFEFRDLIQFAYTLKQEMAANQGRPGQETQVETTKQLLLQSLKDLIQKRHQFSRYFHRLLENGTEWMTAAAAGAAEDTNTSPKRPLSLARSAMRLQSRSQFINAGAKANQNLTSKRYAAALPERGQAFPLQRKSTLVEKSNARCSQTLTSQGQLLDSADGRRDSVGRQDLHERRKPRRQSHLTFGGSQLTQSRAEILAKGEPQLPAQPPNNPENISSLQPRPTGPSSGQRHACGDRRLVAARSSKGLSHQNRQPEQKDEAARSGSSPTKCLASTPLQAVARQVIDAERSRSTALLNIDQEKQELMEEQEYPEVEPEEAKKHQKKHAFLRKGEKTRQVYDPQRAIRLEKLAGRNKSANDLGERPGVPATPKSAVIAGALSISRQNLSKQTPPRISREQRGDPEGPPLRSEGHSSCYLAQNGPRTPQSNGGHMQRIKEIRQTYESPYKQQATASAAIGPMSSFDARGKNFLVINRDRVTSNAALRKKSTSQSRCLAAEAACAQADSQNLRQPKILDSNPVDDRGKRPASRDFVSKIPRLRCSLSRERGSVQGARATTPALARQSAMLPAPSRNIYESSSKGEILNPRGSFNNHHSHTISHFNSQKKGSEGSGVAPSANDRSPGGAGQHERQPSQSSRHRTQPQAATRLRQYIRSPPRTTTASTANGAPAQARSLLEMNEMIRKQNQMYIQEKLQAGQAGHRRVPSNQKSLPQRGHHQSIGSIASTKLSLANNIGNEHEENQRAALECVRNARDGRSASREGQGRWGAGHGPALVATANETVSDISRLTMQASAKILQLSKTGVGKVSRRYQHGKTPSSVSELGQPTVAVDAQRSMAQETRHKPETVAEQQQRAASSPPRGQLTRGSFLYYKHAQHARPDGSKMGPEVSRAQDPATLGRDRDHRPCQLLLHQSNTNLSVEDGSPVRPQVRTYPRQYQDRESSRGRDRDSIMNQASNLQLLLEKFSPLRGMSFENKYVQKQRQDNGGEARAPAPAGPERWTAPGARLVRQPEVMAGRQEHQGDQGVPTEPDQVQAYADEDTPVCDAQDDGDYANDDRGSLQEAANGCTRAGLVDGLGSGEPEPLQEAPKASSREGSHFGMRPPSHNYNRMIDMFESKRCLDLGRSSNFDSQSNTNLASKRVDSCSRTFEERGRLGDQGHDIREGEGRESQVQAEGEDWVNTYQRQAPNNCQKVYLNMARCVIQGVGGGEGRNPGVPLVGVQYASQHVFVAPGSSAASTFRLCPVSIKNKSSMSSWQPSARQSARMEPQVDEEVNSRNLKDASKIFSIPDCRGSDCWEQEEDRAQVATSSRTGPRCDATVHEVQVGDSPADFTRRSYASPHRQKAQHSRGCSSKKSPQRKGQSPNRKVASPLRADKENSSIMEESGAFERFRQVRVELMDNSIDSEAPMGQELTLMMPQILSSPPNISTETRQKVIDGALTAKAGQTMARRRRSRGDRSQGTKSRRSVGKHVASKKLALQVEPPQLARPTLQEITSPGQAQQLAANCCSEKPALTAPEAQPTPQRPPVLAAEHTEDSASFSPEKAHQFSSLNTPQNKVKTADWGSSNWQPGQTPSAHKPASKSGSRQRLTQAKRSRECRQNQGQSPMKTPKKVEQPGYGQAEEPNNFITYSHSRTSTQMYNSSQKSRQDHPHGSGQKGHQLRQYHTAARDFAPTLGKATHQLLGAGTQDCRRTPAREELTHLRT